MGLKVHAWGWRKVCHAAGAANKLGEMGTVLTRLVSRISRSGLGGCAYPAAAEQGVT
jgi:hypothetical protein